MAIKVPIVSEFNSTGLVQANTALKKFGVTSQQELKKAGAGFALLAVGAAKAFSALDAGYDAIIAGTGATGDALDSLKESANSVARTVPNSFEDVGTAIADLNTRLGLTGEPLESMAKKFLDLSRITKSDVSTNIANVTRVFGDAGIAVEDQSLALDKLFEATKRTGIGLERLTTLTVNYGAPMRQLGFSFEESISILGKWEKEGVNIETVMGGMRQGLGRLAKAGEEPIAAFARIVEEIKAAGSAGEANKISLEAFGQRAGPDMAAAIREGRFEIAEMVAGLESAEGSIDSAGEAMLSTNDKIKILANQMLVAAAPAVELLEKVTSLLVGTLGLMPRQVQGVVVALGVLAIASASARSALAAFGKQLSGTSTKAKAAKGALGVASVALIAYSVNAANSAKETANVTAKIEELGRATDEQIAGRFYEALQLGAIAAGGMQKAIDDMSKASPGAVARMLELEESSGLLTTSLTEQGHSAAEAAAVIDTLRASFEDEKVALEQVTKTQEAAAKATDDLSVASGLADTSTRTLGGSAEYLAAKTKHLTEETEAAEQALEAQQEALEENAAASAEALAATRALALEQHAAAGSAFDLEKATLQLTMSVEAYREKEKDTQKTLADSKKTDDEKRAALQGLRLDQIALAEQMLATTETYAAEQGAIEGSTAAAQFQIAELIRMRDLYPEMRNEIDGYIGKLGEIPDTIPTNVQVLIDQGDLDRANYLLDLLARQRTATVTVATAGGVRQADARAGNSHTGSRFAAGETKNVLSGQAFVPDAGLFTAPTSGRMLSPEQTARSGTPTQTAGATHIYNLDGVTIIGTPTRQAAAELIRIMDEMRGAQG